ncbi:ATP-binding protein [Actinomadura gamaensis]|uniref:ATP-binding protein n=1 Tax=Actinomadura gamaensis TaxID=1763541 RepID=A0ABV9UAI4_9ACTN
MRLRQCPPVGTAGEWLWGADEKRWRRAFPGRPDEMASAREFVAALFAEAECLDVVKLVVSELTGNTIRHTRSGEDGGWFELEVVYDDPAYVAVIDNGGGGVPVVKEAVDLLATSGRGLFAVSRLACRMGVDGNPERGHRVWVEIPLGKSLGF